MKYSWKAKATRILLGLIIICAFQNSASSNCEESNLLMAKMEEKEIRLLNDLAKIISIRTHIADDGKKRAAGYQHICESVVNKSTILFVYGQPTVSRFHMNNVKVPLDIGFFDRLGILIHHEVMDVYGSGEHKLYSPGRLFKYALEARVGYFEENDLSPGKSRLVLYSVID